MDAGSAIEQWLTERRTQARTVINMDPKLAELYVGQYQSSELIQVHFYCYEAGERVVVAIPWKTSVRTVPRNHKQVLSQGERMRVTFGKDEQGQVVRLEIDTGGQPMIAERIK